MAGRLTDKQKKKIVADYVKNQNYRETARMNGISDNTVRSLVRNQPETSQKLAQKAEENTQDTLTFMQEQHDTKKRILVKILEAMEKKAESVDMFTNIKDLATAYGIIFDKEVKLVEIQTAKDGKGDAIEIILRRE